MKTYVSHSLEETSNFAREWLERLSTNSSQGGGAIVTGLSGHLGAGKTAFVKALAKHLGITEEITSPTFVIMKIYPTKNDLWKNLIHIDAYRLESGKEFNILGFDKLATDKNNLIVVEWPENVREVFNGITGYRQINFKIDDTDQAKEGESQRIITEE